MKATIIALAALVCGIIGTAIVFDACAEGGCWTSSAKAIQASATPTTPAAAQAAPKATQGSCTPRTPEPRPTPTQMIPAADNKIVGLAIIGDSTADEYRSDNPRGGEFGDTTVNWVELLVQGRDVNVGLWGTKPEPRRSGYEYNWARSGATSQTMIDEGQHTGVAEQIAAGQVSHVILQIGINDFYFSDKSIAILDGTITDQELKSFLDGVIANIGLAIQTLTEAGDATIILAATQDYVSPALLPEVQNMMVTDDAGLQRVVNAFAYLNRGLKDIAERHQVHFFDFNAALQEELERRYAPDDPRYLIVGGERIDLGTKGNEPHHAFVGDEYAHPGTVLSALMANLFIEELNSVGDVGMSQLSDDEILRLAGIRAP